eukprot:gene59248-81120_t
MCAKPRAPPPQPSEGLSGAGSFVLSTESTSVYSTIAQGGNNRNASVAANNNVLVLAQNEDSISAYAGALSVSINAGKGIGASVVVNKIEALVSWQTRSIRPMPIRRRPIPRSITAPPRSRASR